MAQNAGHEVVTVSDDAAEIIERFYQLSEQDQRKVLIRLRGAEDPIIDVARRRDEELDAGLVEPVPDEEVQRKVLEVIEGHRSRTQRT